MKGRAQREFLADPLQFLRTMKRREPTDFYRAIDSRDCPTLERILADHDPRAVVAYIGTGVNNAQTSPFLGALMEAKDQRVLARLKTKL